MASFFRPPNYRREVRALAEMSKITEGLGEKLSYLSRSAFALSVTWEAIASFTLTSIIHRWIPKEPLSDLAATASPPPTLSIAEPLRISRETALAMALRD